MTRRSVVQSAGLLLFSGMLLAATAPSVQESAVDRLGWLAGCWLMQTPSGVVVEEQWMRPRGGMMMGSSRTVRGGAVVEYETIRIHAAEDGAVVYTAQPSGQPAASFRSTHVSDTLVVFENPQHDFPQKIQYQRVGADTLRASIAGPRNGEVRTIAFPYARTRCE